MKTSNGFNSIFFQVFHDKILNGSKTLTIRPKPRVVGKILDVYFGSKYTGDARKVGKLNVITCTKITFLDFKIMMYDRVLSYSEVERLVYSFVYTLVFSLLLMQNYDAIFI